MTTQAAISKESIDLKEMTKDLLRQWLNQKAFLSDQYKYTLYTLGCDCLKEVALLYRMNKAIVSKQEQFTEMEGKLTLDIKEDNCSLVYNGDKLDLKINQLQTVIGGMIDILEEIHPLGTVVDLNKTFLQKHIPAEVEQVRIVVTHRFLYREGDQSYFPYGGVVYPVGMFNNKGIVHFTPALIEKVVHPGYTDIQNEAYIYMMKRELILENGMHSFSFSSAEELKNLQNRIALEEQKHENNL